MKTADLRKKDKKELIKSVTDLRKKLSDLRFKFSSNKLKNTKEMGNIKKDAENSCCASGKIERAPKI